VEDGDNIDKGLARCIDNNIGQAAHDKLTRRAHLIQPAGLRELLETIDGTNDTGNDRHSGSAIMSRYVVSDIGKVVDGDSAPSNPHPSCI
jgi:hypothetical protein